VSVNGYNGAMNSKKVLVGMSGGVDSSVVAAMLLEQGYEVHGVFVEAYNEPGCRTDQDKKDALQVALKLGIPFEVLDLRKEYKDRVVKYFVDEYRAGRTPNPDIVCNREIKFGLLYEYMDQNGYDYLATGHYSRISCGSTKSEIRNSKQILNSKKTNEKYYLQQPVDLSKDQTYFLWQVAREKLDKILWPLGNVEKSWVRQRARELGMPNADKPDSMGVCMIGELNVIEFLKDKLGTKQGDVVWKDQVIGTHEGLWFYTIGARGGWTLNPKSKIAYLKQTKKSKMDLTNLPPLYVTAKNLKLNTLEVGERGECYKDRLLVHDTWYMEEKNTKLWVRIRNLGELTAVTQLSGDTVTLERPVFALAPGQSAVFYDESGCVVGGGIIA
jgi:tRNA-specific 2-thiouridylase